VTTATLPTIPIERPDDGIAIVTLTAPLDADTTAALRGTLTALSAEGRRHVAIDLASVVFAGTAAGIADLARQVESQRAAAGDLYLISPPSGLAEAVKARAFRDRAFWDRFGGLRLMPMPHPIRYTPIDRVLADSEVFYGVPVVEIGEDGEIVLVLGHHEPRRFYAALCAFARRNGCDPADYLLDRVEDLAGFAAKATGWHVIYTHADRATLGNALPGDDPQWCVCDEGCGWYADQVVEGTERAVPTMTYWIGG